jgi:molybdate transport system substrate-binding protein
VSRYLGVAVLVVLLAACGSGEGSFTVYTAGGAAGVLEDLDPDAGYQTDQMPKLVKDLRDGAKADVFVSSSVTDAYRLFQAGLTDRPVTLAQDDVVLAVTRRNPAKIRSLRDLSEDDVTVALARRETYLGNLTRQGLGGRGFFRDTVEVWSPTAVVQKLADGKADAGFIYRTTVAASQGDLKAIYPITPAQYTVSIVRKGDRAAAQAYVRKLLSPAGRRALERAGFTITSDTGKPIP